MYRGEQYWTVTSSFRYTDVNVLYDGFYNAVVGVQSSAVFPTVFLNSDVKITDGNGSSSDPYILSA